MSIRFIARDLYRLHREVEMIEKELQQASAGNVQEIQERLRKALAERQLLRRALDGSKGEAGKW